MSTLRVKGLLKMSPGAIPRAALLADIRRVARMTKSYTMTAYDADGRFALNTIKDRFGTWAHAMACAGLGTAYESSKNQSVTDALAERRAMLKGGAGEQRERIPCLRCEHNFETYDKKKNRICPDCNLSIDSMGPTMEAFG